MVAYSLLQGGKQSSDGTPYSSDTIHLRIERRGPLFTLSYSTNAKNWVPLAEDIVVEMPSDVQVYLYVFSAQNDTGVSAQFNDFIVWPR